MVREVKTSLNNRLTCHAFQFNFTALSNVLLNGQDFDMGLFVRAMTTGHSLDLNSLGHLLPVVFLDHTSILAKVLRLDTVYEEPAAASAGSSRHGLALASDPLDGLVQKSLKYRKSKQTPSLKPALCS